LSFDPAGIAGCEHPVGDVPRDDTASTYHGPRADLDARTDDRAPANPHIGAYLDRLGELLHPPKVGIHGVHGCVDLNRRTEERVGPNPHLAHIEHDAIEIKKDPLTEQNV